MTAEGMTEKKAKELREPFPPASIGKLPKGGVMLDYVGHAAVTDRLLKVDPLWTWEPLALTEEGLPALDRAGNLWIKLTIAGVTRVGVGDGKNAKECIGDAIRNAAMRFGVALDLWAKEDLQAFEDHAPAKRALSSSAGTSGTATPKGAGSNGAPAEAGAPATAQGRQPNASPPAADPPSFVAPAGHGPTPAQVGLLKGLFAKLPASGKTTATDMLHEVATAAGADPSAVTWDAAVALLRKPQASALISKFKDLEGKAA